MIILCCGDRNWTDLETIRRILKTFSTTVKESITVVHGDCRGADKLSGQAAHELGMIVIPEPADWNKYGLAAGPIRNQLMLDKYHPNVVIAFHNNFDQSKGTKDMVNRATKAHITVMRIGSVKQ